MCACAIFLSDCMVGVYGEPGAIEVVFAETSVKLPGLLNVDMDEKRTSDSGSSGNAEEDGADGRQCRRRPPERLWTTALASLVAAVPALLVGYTLGFSSSALLDLTGDAAAGIPKDYVFSSAVADVFAVSHHRNFDD